MILYVWNMSDLFACNPQEELWKKLLGCMEERRRSSIEQIQNTKDKARSLAAGLLLRYAFGNYEKQSQALSSSWWDWERKLGNQLCYGKNISSEIVISWNLASEGSVSTEEMAHGKPRVIGYPQFHFNLSHSGDFVAVLFGELECGVDIQEDRLLSDHFRKRFFQEEEQKYLEENADQDIQLFSMKEAVMKCTGEGMSKGMGSYSVIPLLQGKKMIEKWETKEVILEGIAVSDIKGYGISVVVQREEVS